MEEGFSIEFLNKMLGNSKTNYMNNDSIQRKEANLIEEDNFNNYFIPDTINPITNVGILKNYCGVEDIYSSDGSDGTKDRQELSHYEERSVSAATAIVRLMFKRNMIDKIDKNSLLKIHTILFGAVYPFAGSYRKCNIDTANHRAAGFIHYENIDSELDKVLDKYLNNRIEINSKEELSILLARFYYDLCHIHPFREGNGRTIREFLKHYVEFYYPNYKLKVMYLVSSHKDRDFSNEINTNLFLRAMINYADEVQSNRNDFGDNPFGRMPRIMRESCPEICRFIELEKCFYNALIDLEKEKVLTK